MKVSVVFRGGVGDFFVWLTKIVPILRFHEHDEVHLFAVSKWPEAFRIWASLIDAPPFAAVHAVDYNRPVSAATADQALIGADLVYHCDVWKGERKQPVHDVPLRPVESFFGWLEPEWHPQLRIDGDEVGGTVIQVEGQSVGGVCDPEWWRAGLEGFPGPIRLLGSLPKGTVPEDFGASERITDPIAIYAAIKSASVMAGIDSGLRNIAFTLRTPVIEIRQTPGKDSQAYPDYDVFVPHVYRDRLVFLDLDPPKLNSVLGRVEDLMGRRA